MAYSLALQPRDGRGRWMRTKRKPTLLLMSPEQANNWISSGILYGTTAITAYKWFKKRKKKKDSEERRKIAIKGYQTRKTVVVKKSKTKR